MWQKAIGRRLVAGGFAAQVYSDQILSVTLRLVDFHVYIDVCGSEGESITL